MRGNGAQSSVCIIMQSGEGGLIVGFSYIHSWSSDVSELPRELFEGDGRVEALCPVTVTILHVLFQWPTLR